MLVCDTSGLVAYFDSDDAHHAAASATISSDPGPFVVSPYVVAELDYLLATRRGVQAELVALAELAGGAWDLVVMTAADVRGAAEIIGRYRHHSIGLADASLVVLAAQRDTDRLLTLDHRHFRVVQTLRGRPFRLLPADS